MDKFERGQILLIDFDRGQGSEQSGVRPGVVVSNSANNTFSDVLTVVPMTTKKDDYDFHLRIFPASNNKLQFISYCLPEQIRCVSVGRVIESVGFLSYLQIRKLEDHLRFQLDL